MSGQQNSFPKRLRFVREMRELSQSALGRAAGLDPSAIAHFEAGRREPSMRNLRKLCKAAMVSSDYLIGLTERVIP